MRMVSNTILQLGLLGPVLCVVLGANVEEFRSIFDGTTGRGWMLCDGKPLPKAFVQSEGLNPHGTGSYLVVHETKVDDFVLDEWNTPGKRPDGSQHKFSKVAIGKLPREGYFGFQDHGSDCWFKNIKLKVSATAKAAP